MLNLRKATLEDSRLIWEWRNDPMTRQLSRTTEAIPWEKHAVWYERAVNDPKKIILMAQEDSRTIGMVRFDYVGDKVAEININLNPGMRGKGYGKSMLAAACNHGFKAMGLNSIYAEIKPENIPSIKIFEGAGFVFQGTREDLRTYMLTRGD